MELDLNANVQVKHQGMGVQYVQKRSTVFLQHCRKKERSVQLPSSETISEFACPVTTFDGLMWLWLSLFPGSNPQPLEGGAWE